VVDRGLDVRSATRPVCPDGMRSPQMAAAWVGWSYLYQSLFYLNAKRAECTILEKKSA
jgi:hypothetical protein